MRTQFPNVRAGLAYPLFAALGFAITLTFTACEEKKKQDGTTATEAAAETQEAANPAIAESNGNGGGKLLETITNENGTVKFEYDKQNRIIKIDDETITYADNLITVGTKKYVINGNTITLDDKSFTVNGDGYIVESKVYWFDTYEYKDGNLIGIKGHSLDDSSNENGSGYSYDNKKSPFSNSNTPKWLIQRLLEPHDASKNNIIEDSWNGEASGGCNHKYQYDGDGFPVTDTITCYSEGEESTIIKRYTYRGKTK